MCLLCFKNMEKLSYVDFCYMSMLHIAYLEFDDHNTRKCGEIVFDTDDETFTLNCFSCAAICFDLLTFCEHVKKQHASLLKQTAKNPLDDMEKINENANNTNEKLNTVINAAIKEVRNSEIETLDFEVNSGTQSPSSVLLTEDEEESNKVEADNFEIKMDNHAVISQFIYLIKQKPTIWNKSIETLSYYQKPRSAITTVIDSLEISFPDLTFTFANVSKLLNTLRKSYNNELKQMENAEKQNMKFIPSLWCFDQLNFLKDSLVLDGDDVDEGFHRIVSRFPLDIYQGKTPGNNELITLDIIDHYEKQPQLWNINHPEYSGSLNNEESFQLFYDLVSKKYSDKVNITKDKFKMAIKQMHQWYIAEKGMRRYMKKLCKPYDSYYPRIFNALTFLQCNLPPMRCKTCGKIYKTDENYVRHKKQCVGEVHECEYCQKRFPALRFLRNHLFLHSNDRPVVCAICGKSYKNNVYLSVHMRTTHSEKLFKCDECDQSFRTRAVLTIHQKAHLGIRDKICDICGKTFTASKYLYSHRITHLEGNRRKCNNCNKTYSVSSFASHRRNCATKLLQKSTKRTRRKKTAILKADENESNLNNSTNQVKTIVRAESRMEEKPNDTIIQFEIEPYYSAYKNECSSDKDISSD